MDEAAKQVEQWLSSIVIDLNLCPFAKREYQLDRIRFKTSAARSEQEVLQDLIVELSLLTKRVEIETSLLILPLAMDDFLHFNDFLGFADTVLEEMKLDGIFQLASFHPKYQFSGTEFSDVENFTNRSPYPILHILREASLEKAIANHPNTEQIPEDNIALMKKLGNEHMQALLNACSAGHEQ